MFWESDNAIKNIEYLAAEHRRNRNLAQAKSLYTCLIAMVRRACGADSKQLALTFYRLAECYSDEGNVAAAKIYYLRASETWLKAKKIESVSPLWFSQSLHEIQEMADRTDDYDQLRRFGTHG